jgi:putative transposase
VWLDALTIKVRELAPDRPGHALLAVGVNADGQREVLGLAVASGQDGAGWLAFLRGLPRPRLGRCPAGHLRQPRRPGRGCRRALPGASWQRCRTARNLATKVPKGAQPRVLTLLRTAFDQPDADQVGAQVARVVEALDAKFPAAAGLPGTPAALVSCQ